MPIYNVVMRGTGIELPSVDDPIRGFETTRRVKASTGEAASERAKLMVVKEWQAGGYQDRNRASAPVVSIETAERLSLWKRLTTKVPKEGFTFHT